MVTIKISVNVEGNVKHHPQVHKNRSFLGNVQVRYYIRLITVLHLLLHYCIFLSIVIMPAQSSQGYCTPKPELENQGNWEEWCKTNCGTPPGTAPACDGSGNAYVKCICGQNSGKMKEQKALHTFFNY